MRAATTLRCPTCPARLATRNPSTATGITMAMKARAASTSASVKAWRACLAADAGRIVRLNLIVQAVGVLHDGHASVSLVPLVSKYDEVRTGLADETVRRKAKHRCVARGPRGLIQLARADQNGRR